MIRSFLFFIALNTVCVYLVNQMLEGFVVTGGTFGLIVVGVVIGFLNAVLKPLLKILSLPLIFLTAGLFVLVINAVILWFAEFIIGVLSMWEIQLLIDGMGSYIAAVVLFGVFNYLFQKLLRTA